MRRARPRRGRTWVLLIVGVAVLAIVSVVVISGVGAAIIDEMRASSTAATPSPSREPTTAAPTPDATTEPEPSPSETVPPPPAPPAPPVSPADTACATPVTMSVWAHADDDLIFMNPELTNAIAAGDCVRTVFITGADAGRGEAYARGRELGILRAYNDMRQTQGYWTEHPVTLLTGVVASQWSPDNDPDITVTFLRLPDGNLTGGGFPSTGNVSLPQLIAGSIPSLTPTNGGPPATLAALDASIAELIGAYHATRLFTLVPGAAGDHPDHAATGTIVRNAWKAIGFPAANVSYVLGYPSADLPVNVTGDVLTQKLRTFRIYAAEDKVVKCDTDAACLAKPKFGAWLQRHYTRTEAETFPNG